METPQELCESCKLLEAAGITTDLAYESDRDIPSEESSEENDELGPSKDDEYEDKVSDDEAELLKGQSPTVEGYDDEDEAEDDVETPVDESLAPLKRVKRAYIQMPTGKKFKIPSPSPKSNEWSCRKSNSTFSPVKPYGKTRDEYKIIKKEMENTIVYHPFYNFKGYDIIKIEKITNGCLWRQYLHRQKEIRAECGFVNQRMLWHGSKSVDDIAQHGFNEQYSSVRGMFGAGIYFAKHSSKSNQYVFNTAKASECPLHQDMNCKVCERKQILCRVALGKSKHVYQMKRYYHAPAGFHSVTALPSHKKKGLKYPEYIIYRREQAYPEYLITYKLV